MARGGETRGVRHEIDKRRERGEWCLTRKGLQNTKRVGIGGPVFAHVNLIMRRAVASVIATDKDEYEEVATHISDIT